MSDQEEDNDEDDIEDEDMDDDEEEQDEYFDLQEIHGDNEEQLVGENLLIQQFNLRGQEALRQQNMTRTAVEESKKNAHNASVLNQSKLNNRPEPFNRPATPSLSISQISHSQIQGQQDPRRDKLQNNIIQKQNIQNNTKQNSLSIHQKQLNVNKQEMDIQNQQQYMNKEYKQTQTQQQKSHNQQSQQMNNQRSGQQHNPYQQYKSSSYQIQNELENYYSNSPQDKNLNPYLQYNQQQLNNPQQQNIKQFSKHSQQNQQIASKLVKPPAQEIKTDTKEAFAPRHKIPRTPPKEDDE